MSRILVIVMPVERKDNNYTTLSDSARAALKSRAIEMLMLGKQSPDSIANELNVNRRMVLDWMKETKASIPGSKKPTKKLRTDNETPEEKKTKKKKAEVDSDVISKLSEQEKTDIIRIGELLARDAEDGMLDSVVDTDASIADQYQSYIANFGMKLLRDCRGMLKGPRTVRELAELDQLIRRNLGLNPKGGMGNAGSNLIVDVRILNNPQTDLHKPEKVIDLTEAD